MCAVLAYGRVAPFYQGKATSRNVMRLRFHHRGGVTKKAQMIPDRMARLLKAQSIGRI